MGGLEWELWRWMVVVVELICRVCDIVSEWSDGWGGYRLEVLQ